MMLEYCYWWRGCWLLETWSHRVCRSFVFNLLPLSISRWKAR